MFRAGNFYVEYQIESNVMWVSLGKAGMVSSVPKSLASSIGPSSRSYISMTPKFLSFLSSSRNKYHVVAGKDGARVFRADAKEKNPDAFYQDGKYYNFLNDTSGSTQRKASVVKRLLVLPEDQLDSPILDPNEEWQSIRDKLALPDELAIFYWNEPYREKDSGWGEPTYRESSKKVDGKKEYDCDRYVVDIKSLAGTILAQEAYDALYEGGKLVKVQKYFIHNGNETLIETMTVKNITAEVPDTAFEVKKKVKVYKPRNGDMNDLLEIYEEDGEIGGKKK